MAKKVIKQMWQNINDVESDRKIFQSSLDNFYICSEFEIISKLKVGFYKRETLTHPYIFHLEAGCREVEVQVLEFNKRGSKFNSTIDSLCHLE